MPLLALLSFLILSARLYTSEAFPLSSMSTAMEPPENSDSGEAIRWKVRPATHADADAASNVLKASYTELLKPDYDEDLLRKAVPFMSTPRESLLTCGTWFVVEHPTTKEITGCGGWTAEAPKVAQLDPSSEPLTEKIEEKSKIVPHLRHFACHPDWKRRGVARSIWDRTWKEICEQIGPATELEVYSTLSAVPFYESLGFVPERSLDIPLDGKALLFPAVLMRREP
eukprot:CAMPEP_0172442404 /NCGR_PEP_ID=MMETSP1065-20121228/2838_1 /TAXON_ID=265537 /ORGANISM="Amphiprora paludosa, Strain CCMP125" /LENGTH=226 /DNA_ID=CAMNT_0013192245 /DNA_START=8 /DNA_END=688 /DNA_ORIENTATION=-